MEIPVPLNSMEPSLATIKGLEYSCVLSIYYVDVGVVDAFKLGVQENNLADIGKPDLLLSMEKHGTLLP